MKPSSAMATFTIFTCFLMLTFLSFPFKILSLDPNCSFSFESFGKDSNFGQKISLFGDAKPVYNGSSLQLTHWVSSSAGMVMYKKPIMFVEGNPGILVSFSTHFSFSMSRDSGDGLAFIMVRRVSNISVFGDGPFGLNLGSGSSNLAIVAVEFDTRRDAQYADLNENHVGIDVGGFVSAKVRNVSSINTGLNSGKRLHSWIDYEAGSKRLEVRLSQFGDSKPIDPLLLYPIDLSKVFPDEKVFIGLSSANRDSSQTCFLYSWSFMLRHAPHWMHSQPLDPQAFAKNAKPVVVANKKSDCLLRVLAAMIFGTTCGTVGAFIVLYLWTVLGNRRPVVPEECPMHPEDFEYKKVKVVVRKTIEDGKQ